MIPGLNISENKWLDDEGLADFFKHQGSLPPVQRLSAVFGHGLY
jgi:hypothetical protein